MPIIAILSLKGGVGKTTSAMHIAAVAQAARMKPVLLDCDSESSAHRWAARAGTDLGFDVHLANRDKIAAQLRDLEKPDRTVIVDTPPNNREIIARVGQMANVVIVPLNPTGLDVDRLQPTLELLADLEAARGELAAYILLSKFNPQRKLDREAADALAGFPVLQQRIRGLQAYAEAFGGMPTYLDEYKAVWQEIRKDLMSSGRVK
jgi:chromosome partitioning protein